MNARIIIFIGIITGICTACSTVEVIDVSLDKPKVVVNTLFDPDSTWCVSLTYTRDIINVNQTNFFQPVRDAVVEVYDQSGNLEEAITDPFDLRFPDRYKGTKKPSAGKTYSIKVKIDGEVDIESASEIPVQVPIESYRLDSTRYKSQPGEKVQMRLTVKDPPYRKNYYYIKIIREAYVIGLDTIRFTEDVHYELIDPAYKEALESPLNDNLFDGEEYNIDFNINPFAYVNAETIHLKVALLSISESYYLYLTTKNVQSRTNGDPFAQPTLIYSNISGGTGLFAGYSASLIVLK